MATQTVTLTQPYGNRSAVLCTLARQKAVNAVKEQLRAQGLKLAHFSSRDIHTPQTMSPTLDRMGKRQSRRVSRRAWRLCCDGQNFSQISAGVAADSFLSLC
jgi:hypothetical protein